MQDKILLYLEETLPSYLDDLRTLTAIDSGRDNKMGGDAVNDWLAARLSKLRFEITREIQSEVADNLIATRQGNGQGRLMLLGHSDTVFPIGTAAERPLMVDYAADKIYGPGTCDMKAGLLTGLYAIEALLEAGFDRFETLEYLCVSDEESDPRPSIPLIQARSRQADVAFTLEAARENGDIVVARKGLRVITISARGKSAHAGVEPEKGHNAIVDLIRLLDQVSQLNGWRDGVTVNVGTIQGGTLPNVVPDQAEARLDLRAWNEETLDDLIEAIWKQIKTANEHGSTISLTVDPGSISPAMPLTPAVSKLEAQAVQIAAELGFELKGARTGGASDAALVAAEGVPVIDGLGPIGGLDHSPDEYITLSSIVPRTALLALLMAAVINN